MDRQLAFRFEARYCTGCQTCRIACDDAKGRLAEGGHAIKPPFRRVTETESGGYSSEGAAWIADVRVSFGSETCRHCASPACIASCLAGAIVKRREDGIVIIDALRCTGCGACIATCPFGAVSLDPERSVAEKCDFCLDELRAGRDPVCVTACPMRALSYGPVG